jgi:hypothetical protein
VDGTPLAGLVQARVVDHALTELQEDIEFIASNLSGFPFTAAINVQENRIDIEVDSPGEIEAYARERGFQLPATAHLVVMGPSVSRECGDEAGAEYGIFFPRHCAKPWQPVPQAAMEAPLVLRDGCLWLAPLHAQETYLALWPPGWTPVRVGEVVEIRDADGVRRGAIGEPIAVGGGVSTDPGHIAQLVGEEPPPLCRSQRAWLVSGPLGG